MSEEQVAEVNDQDAGVAPPASSAGIGEGSFSAVPPPAEYQTTANNFLSVVAKAKAIAAKLAGQVHAAADAVGESHKRPAEDDFSGQQDAKRAMMFDPNMLRKEEFFIPNDQVGRVIGKSGETINRIKIESGGCQVQISQDITGPQRSSELTGNTMQIENAKRLILQVISETPLAAVPSFITGDEVGMPIVKDMPIPSHKVGLVIGKGGDTIKQLQERAGVRMQMIQDDPTAAIKPLRITGQAEAIKRAEEMVAELISDKLPEETSPVVGPDGRISSGDIASNLSAFASKKVEVEVPKLAVGSVIGKNGETIKRIQAETGARVQFDMADQGRDSRTCNISGIPHTVTLAEEMVKKIIAESLTRGGGLPPSTPSSSAYGTAPASSPYSASPSQYGGAAAAYGTASPYGGAAAGGKEEMRVPSHRCGLVIGKGGETIKQIQSMSGARVQLDNNPTNPAATEKLFTITGTPQQIAAAKHMINEKVSGDTRTPVGGMSPYGAPAMYGATPAAAYGAYPGYPVAAQPYPGMYGAPAGYPQAQQPAYHQPQYQQQQYQQQPQAAAAPPASTQPSSGGDDNVAPAPGYPTKAEYQANIVWYNSQGYFGVVPNAAPAAASTAPTTTTATDTTTQSAPDYSAQWAAYLAAGGQMPQQ